MARKYFEAKCQVNTKATGAGFLRKKHPREVESQTQLLLRSPGRTASVIATIKLN